MKRKYVISISVVLILLILAGGYMMYSRTKAKTAIYDYMEQQGISKSQLDYADFHMDFMEGGYWLAVYVEGENPDVYYEYTYKNKQISFAAYENNAADIKKKIWGGNGLSDKELKQLKYPPLHS